MSINNKLKVLVVAILFCTQLVSAQMILTNHFFDNIAQHNFSNPALFGDFNVSVNLPSPGIGFSNNTFKFSDVATQNGSVLNVNMDEIISRTGADGFDLGISSNIQTFSAFVQTKKMLISLNHGVDVETNLNISKDFLQFFWEGNASYIDQTANLAPYLNINASHHIGLGFAYKLTEKLALGTRLKRHWGLATLFTPPGETSIYTDPEYYQLTATTDYTIFTGGLSTDGNTIEDILDFDFDPKPFTSNTGFSVDFGGTYKLTDRIQLRASVLNLGSIKWTENVNAVRSQGTFTFEGLDLKPLLEDGKIDFETLSDSIQEIFQLTTSQESFKTTLPARFLLSGTYALGKGFQGGLVLYGEKTPNLFMPGLGVSIKKEFGTVFSIGTQYTAMNGSHNVGFMSALRLLPLQIYMVTDNVLPLFNPLNTQSFNFRTGVNIVIGNIQKRVRTAGEREAKEIAKAAKKEEKNELKKMDKKAAKEFKKSQKESKGQEKSSTPDGK